MGYVWQQGLIPISLAAIDKAIELNNVAVPFNKKAFEWGRRMAHDPLQNQNNTAERSGFAPEKAALPELLNHRAKFLVKYQDESYAREYREYVEWVCQKEKSLVGDSQQMTFSRAVVEGLFKLMAYKDEYEVARLLTSHDFQSYLRNRFEGKSRLTFHLAPPLLSKRDPQTGHLVKREFGAWIIPLFKMLAKLKFIRGSRFDVFGYTSERKMERKLIEEYRHWINELLPEMTVENYETAVAIAKLPLDMRGFGHVKEANVNKARQDQKVLLQQFCGTNDSEQPVRMLETTD